MMERVFVILSKRLERGRFSQINPLFPGEVVMTEAEFGLFFEGADLEKRFLRPRKERAWADSPPEVVKSSPPTYSI